MGMGLQGHSRQVIRVRAKIIRETGLLWAAAGIMAEQHDRAAGVPLCLFPTELYAMLVASVSANTDLGCVPLTRMAPACTRHNHKVSTTCQMQITAAELLDC